LHTVVTCTWSKLLRRCPDAEPLTQTILYGYRLTYRRGVATVEKADKEDRVYGALYRISKRDMKALDTYEGYPRVYYRDTVQVEARGMGGIHAMTYRCTSTLNLTRQGQVTMKLSRRGTETGVCPWTHWKCHLKIWVLLGYQQTGRGITLLKIYRFFEN